MIVPGISRPGSERKRRSDWRFQTTPDSTTARECTPEFPVPAFLPTMPTRLGPSVLVDGGELRGSPAQRISKILAGTRCGLVGGEG